jgi:hypothetical protein
MQKSIATRCSRTGEAEEYLNRLFSTVHGSADQIFSRKQK